MTQERVVAITIMSMAVGWGVIVFLKQGRNDMTRSAEVDWTCPGCKQSYFLPANLMAREQKHHQECVA